MTKKKKMENAAGCRKKKMKKKPSVNCFYLTT